MAGPACGLGVEVNEWELQSKDVNIRLTEDDKAIAHAAQLKYARWLNKAENLKELDDRLKESLASLEAQHES